MKKFYLLITILSVVYITSKSQTSQLRIKNDSLVKNIARKRSIDKDFNKQDYSNQFLLDSVIVTANKFPQKQSATGKVISLINKDQLILNNGKTISEVLNEQVGIQIGGAFGSLGTLMPVYTRGAASGRTLILIDGIPIYNPTQNNEFDLNLLNIQNIERVEILKGAQSTLYGSDAIAGIINFMSPKPQGSRQAFLNAQLSSGSFNTNKAGIEWGSNLGKFSFIVQNNFTNSSGFSYAKDTFTNKIFANNPFNGYNNNITLNYNISPTLTLKNYYRNSYYKNNIDAGAFVDEKDFTSSNNNFVTGIYANLKINQSSLTFNYQYSENKILNINDSLDVPGFTKFSSDRYYGKSEFLELYANIKISKSFRLLSGIDYRFNNINIQYFSLSAFGPYASDLPDTSIGLGSLYSSLYWTHKSQKLNIELGGRINFHSQYGDNSTFTFNPSYNFDNHFRIFGSVSTGFRAPSLFQLYSSYGNANLNPEKSFNTEIGVSQSHNILKTRLVYFNRVIENGIDFDYVNFKYFNYNEQRVNGLEIENNIEITKNFNFLFNYTYLNIKEYGQSRITTKDTTYSYGLKRPQHNLNVTLGYKFLPNLYGTLSAKYLSSRYDVGGYKMPDLLLDAYWLFNAHLQYTYSSKLLIYLDCRNLTDTQFYETYGYQNSPMNVTLGLTLKL